MENWPPAEPSLEQFDTPLGTLISKAKQLLKQENSRFPAERKIITNARRNNTLMALANSWHGKLVVVMETRTRSRPTKLEVLRRSETKGLFTFPTNISHQAVNSLQDDYAETIADLLVAWFMADMEEQHEFAADVGAPKRELERLTTEFWDEDLHRIHEDIRLHALPLFGRSSRHSIRTLRPAWTRM